MYELLFSTGVTIFLQVLSIVVKNPDKKEKYRKSMLMVRDAINVVYEPAMFDGEAVRALPIIAANRWQDRALLLPKIDG